MLEIKNQKPDPSVPPLSISALFDLSCTGHNHDVVANQKGYDFTRADLKRDRKLLARAFCQMGVKRGDIITVATGRSLYDLIVIFLAANRIGAIVAFLDEKTSDNTLIQYLNEFESKVLITYHKTPEQIHELVYRANTVRTAINLTVDLDHRNFKRTVLETFMVGASSVMRFAGEYEGRVPNYRFNAKDEALISFTSGSTSGPKPMVFTNEALIADAIYSKVASGVKMWDKELHTWMSYVRLDCPYGLVVSVLAPILGGGEVILTPDISDSNLNYYIGKNPNTIFGVPPLLESLPELLSPDTDIHELKMFASGGERLEAEVSRKAVEFFKSRGATVKISNGYGVGEALGLISTAVGNTAYNPDSVGKIPAGSHVMVLDPKTGEELGFNKTGMLYFTGKHMMNRYFNRPELTKEKIVVMDGKKFVNTGDLACVSEDGFITLVGRATFFINNIPAKVYYEVVRMAVSKSSLVKKCYVVKGPDPEYKLGAYAFVVLNDDVKVADGEIRHQIFKAATKPFILGQREIVLKPYELPRQIIFMDDLPLTRANKTDFQKLEQLAKEIGSKKDLKPLSSTATLFTH